MARQIQLSLRASGEELARIMATNYERGVRDRVRALPVHRRMLYAWGDRLMDAGRMLKRSAWHG